VNSSWTHRRSSRHPNHKCIPSGYCLPSSELAKLGQKPEGLLGEHDDITQRLHAWRNGEQGALDSLIPAVYPELHRMALNFVRNESKGSGTLQATGLVNELYLVLVNRRKVDFEQRNQFFALAAHLMRVILIDVARQRRAQKRGGPDAIRIPLSEDLHWVDATSEEMLDLDRALGELTKLEPRKTEMMVLKAFLGCSTQEAAELAGVSKATADRDLRFVKAWLYQRMHPDLSC
jgi:RNA polymerase sigma factor (TIGR02999 family)